jgi:hypothetical protein
MNQGIEARTIQIASNDRLELFLVELDYFADCFTQERPAVPWLADNKSGSSRFAVLKALGFSFVTNCFKTIALLKRTTASSHSF